MKISVIIPVYNAEKYVKRAVESSLQQDECAEVILVEDRSPDNALKICQNLVLEHENVHLYQHSGNVNKGPGPSRNLGVLNSTSEYIAFLDADDYYLPNRFKKAVTVLASDPDIDGIYEPVGCVFECDESKRRYFDSHSSDIEMLHDVDHPEHTYESMLSGKNGYIHLDGFVVKKSKFIKVGMFPDLRLHEDTILTLKLAAVCKLMPGEKYHPVALRQLHMSNTITKPGIDFLETRCLAFKNCLEWMRHNNIENSKQNLLKAKYYRINYRRLKNNKNYFLAAFYYIYLKFFLDN